MTLVVFGSINLDLTAYAPRLPRPGETLLGRSFLTVTGGKGANQAAAAARLGAVTRMIGRVGDDAFGREALAALAAEGIDMAGVAVDSAQRTGLGVICVDDAAENAIIVISGANMALGEPDVARCTQALADARALLLQLEVPLAANLAAARAAHERGVTVILDPAPAPAQPLPADLYPLIDVITPNEVEAEALTGIRPETPEEAARAAADLRARGARAAVIKLGARGAVFAGEAGAGFVPPFPVQAVDSVAAGDAFNGALAAALAAGFPLPEAVRRGAAAGAIAVTRPGALPSMPHRAELDDLLTHGRPA